MENSKDNQAPATPEPVQVDAVYANNTFLESSIWDLKILFGQLDMSTGTERVEWRTAVTLPWIRVKLLYYYLGMNIAGFEALQGKIVIPDLVMPALPDPPPADSKDPRHAVVYAKALELHKELK